MIIWDKILVIELLFVLVFSNTAKFSYKLNGGYDADKNSWRFLVAIVCGRVVHCGGSLIKPKFVLTAAHCVQGDNIDMHKEYFGDLNVRLGPADLDYISIEIVVNPDQLPNVVHAKVSVIADSENLTNIVDKIIIHPEYYIQKHLKNDKVMDVIANDVALIKLSEEFKNVPSVSLPTKSIYETKFCKTAGWGSKSIHVRRRKNQNSTKNVLQALDLLFLDKKQCRNLLTDVSKANDASYEDTEKLTLNKVCCVTYFNRGSVHNGDSGCPLICNGELHGLANLAIQQFPTENKVLYSSVFTEIAYYTDWIDKVLSSEGCGNLAGNIYRAAGNFLKGSFHIILFCITINIFIY